MLDCTMSHMLGPRGFMKIRSALGTPKTSMASWPLKSSRKSQGSRQELGIFKYTTNKRKQGRREAHVKDGLDNTVRIVPDDHR